MIKRDSSFREFQEGNGCKVGVSVSSLVRKVGRREKHWRLEAQSIMKDASFILWRSGECYSLHYDNENTATSIARTPGQLPHMKT